MNSEASAWSQESEEKAIEVLCRIRARLDEIGEPVTKSKQYSEDANMGVECICCLLPIEKGSHFIHMPCCGSVCHLLCIVRIAKSHQLLMNHACPRCQKELSPEELELFVKMYPILCPNAN